MSNLTSTADQPAHQPHVKPHQTADQLHITSRAPPHQTSIDTKTRNSGLLHNKVARHVAKETFFEFQIKTVVVRLWPSGVR